MEDIPNLIQFIKFLIKITLICIIIHYLKKIIKYQIQKYKENNYILISHKHRNFGLYISKKTFQKFLNSNKLNYNFYRKLFIYKNSIVLESFKWMFKYDKDKENILQIGCVEKTFEFWDEFFSEKCKKTYDTPRDSDNFKYLKKTYELFKEEISNHLKIN